MVVSTMGWIGGVVEGASPSKAYPFCLKLSRAPLGYVMDTLAPHCTHCIVCPALGRGWGSVCFEEHFGQVNFRGLRDMALI